MYKMGESVIQYWRNEKQMDDQEFDINLKLKEFLTPPTTEDSLNMTLLTILVVFSFILTVCSNTKTLVQEKEIKLKVNVFFFKQMRAMLKFVHETILCIITYKF